MLLADVCARFVNVAPDDVDSRIESAQRLICESLKVNHSSVWQVSNGDAELLVMTHAYRDPKLQPLPSRPILKEHFPWSQSKILKKEIISIPNTARAPRGAAIDRKSWLRYGIRSALAFPLSVGGRSVIGLLAFDSTEKRDWPESLQRRLQILALVFAQALDRKNSEQKMRIAEEALRASEERLRLSQQAARLGAFEWNIQTGVNTWTPELEAMYGLPRGTFGRSQPDFEKLLHPDDRPRVTDLVATSFRTGQPMDGEWRVIWPDRSIHWIAGRWQVFMNRSGEPARMVGVNSDITERKRAEQALDEMTRKLIAAQEQERARIGRELHDDINQRLALLAVELEQLQENPSRVRRQAQELRERVTEISADVQALSHDLHSSKLEYLGVLAGIRSWCKEFAERQKMEIDFRADVPSVLPLEVGLCTLRVLQEALHNAQKHSGVRRVEVQLWEDSNEIHLVVSDLGRGFDVEAASKGKGLGLTSMRERVRLVNGMISIDSRPTCGTKVHVRVPLGTNRESARAAG
jgi:PAS domain S-box-containing protein